MSLGARRNFSRGRLGNHRLLTRFWRAVHIIDHFFGVPKVLTKIFAFFFATIYTIFIGYLLRALKASAPMGARRGGGKGGTCPLEFEKMTSYVAVLQTTLKFSHAPLALAMDTLYVSVKSRKNASIHLRLRRPEKRAIFCKARRKRVKFFKSWWFCPPLENFCGRS